MAVLGIRQEGWVVRKICGHPLLSGPRGSGISGGFDPLRFIGQEPLLIFEDRRSFWAEPHGSHLGTRSEAVR